MTRLVNCGGGCEFVFWATAGKDRSSQQKIRASEILFMRRLLKQDRVAAFILGVAARRESAKLGHGFQDSTRQPKLRYRRWSLPARDNARCEAIGQGSRERRTRRLRSQTLRAASDRGWSQKDRRSVP